MDAIKNSSVGFPREKNTYFRKKYQIDKILLGLKTRKLKSGGYRRLFSLKSGGYRRLFRLKSDGYYRLFSLKSGRYRRLFSLKS